MTKAPKSSFLHVVIKNALYTISHKATKFALVFAVLIVGAIFYGISKHKDTKESYTVTRGNFKQYVHVSGSVEASKDATLSFQSSGTVSKVLVKTGDTVKQGDVLVKMSSLDQEASLLSAKASLDNAQITLDQLKEGPRKEEIAIKQQAYDNAKSSLDQTYLVIPDVIRNVDATTADVLKNKLAPLFTNQNGRYTLSFSSCDQLLQSTVEQTRTDIENTLALYQQKSSTITAISSREAIDAAVEDGYNATILTNSLINLVSNILLAPCSTQNATLDTYRTTLTTVRTTMNTLFTDISTKRSTLTTAKNAYSQSLRDLELVKAGTDPYKIRAQAALVSQAQANVLQAEQSLAKTRITAPFSGSIGEVDIMEGETASVGKAAITMIAGDAFEIEAKVPEIDIVKVTTGSDVEVTLDAYGKGVVFNAIVTRISPTATTEGTVPMYKVVITFKDQDPRIKSGMTANVDIITENRTSVLAVPARFVTLVNGNTGSVTVLRNGRYVTQDIEVGARSSDGAIEVLQGLLEGDVILAPEIGVRKAQKES
jgi:RND family efflux transporter MFP subunit